MSGSLVQPFMVKTVALSIGIDDLAAELVRSVAADAEFHLRQLLQDAQKFARHSKRTKLTPRDVNNALKLRNLDPLFGHETGLTGAGAADGDAGSAAHTQRVISKASTKQAGEVFFVEEPRLALTSVIHAPLPRFPLAPSFTAHWLAVEGVQPTIPANPSPLVIAELAAAEGLDPEIVGGSEAALHASMSSRQRDEARGLKRVREARVVPFVKHVLSQELQLYYQQLTAAVLDESDSGERRALWLHSVRTETGISQLLPYLTHFVSFEVSRSLRSLHVLSALIDLAAALLDSPHLHVAPYAHQLVPAVLTCVVGRRLCAYPTEDHWSLRDKAAAVLRHICDKYSAAFVTLLPRVTNTLIRALLEPTRPITTHYGACVGLTALGPKTIELLVLANVEPLLGVVRPALSDADPTRRSEALRFRGALARAVMAVLQHRGCTYDKGKFTASAAATPAASAVDALIASVPDLAVDLASICALFGDNLQAAADQTH